MYKLFLPALFLFTVANAQSGIEITTGYSIFNLESFANENVDYSQKGNLLLGIGYRQRLSQNINLSTGISLMPAGGKISAIKQLPESFCYHGETPAAEQLYANARSNLSLTYLKIPLMGDFTFGEDISYHIFFGPYIGVPIKANIHNTWLGPIFTDASGGQILEGGKPSSVLATEHKNVLPDLKSVNFGLTGGNTLNIPIGLGEFSVGYNISFGVQNIYKKKASNGPLETTSVEFTAGYFFPLK